MPAALYVLICSDLVLFCSDRFCFDPFHSTWLYSVVVLFLLSDLSFCFVLFGIVFLVGFSKQMADVIPDSSLLKHESAGVCGAVHTSQQLSQHLRVEHDAASRALPLTDSGIERKTRIAICILQRVGSKMLACGPHLQANFRPLLCLQLHLLLREHQLTNRWLLFACPLSQAYSVLCKSIQVQVNVQS